MIITVLSHSIKSAKHEQFWRSTHLLLIGTRHSSSMMSPPAFGPSSFNYSGSLVFSSIHFIFHISTLQSSKWLPQRIEHSFCLCPIVTYDPIHKFELWRELSVKLVSWNIAIHQLRLFAYGMYVWHYFTDFSRRSPKIRMFWSAKFPSRWRLLGSTKRLVTAFTRAHIDCLFVIIHFDLFD